MEGLIVIYKTMGTVRTSAQARALLNEPATRVAPLLLGSLLIRDAPEGSVTIRLTEVEAYEGTNDPGSHAYRGKTPRTEVMFGEGGRAYVYFTYGMHHCLNVVCGPEGLASAVLFRAGEVIDGRGIAELRRPTSRRERDLARGPARLTSAMNITGAFNGADLLDEDSSLRLVMLHLKRASVVKTGPRVGISGPGGSGQRFPWRFWIADDPTVSLYRAAPK